MSKNNSKYNWPLAINDFTLWDRLKICLFYLNKNNRWTQDKYVRQYEYQVASYIGCSFAVFVSSGSAANQLIAQRVKDKLLESGEWPNKNKVVVSAVTWTTNVSVWIREGFEPIFLDVTLDDFALDIKQLEKVLSERAGEIACVFPTSVLGYSPNLAEYKKLHYQYNVDFYMDNCENFFGTAKWSDHNFENKNVSNIFTSSTSSFLAHQIYSGGEGGFIFTNDYEEYKYFILARAHGLSRNLIPYRSETIYSDMADFDPLNSYYPWELEPIYNDLVDQQFNFTCLSSNYRNTDIAAFCGLLNLNKVEKNKQHRISIYNVFRNNLDELRYYLPKDRDYGTDVAFCLPIITKGERSSERMEKVKIYLDLKGIEYRSFISGNMLRQTPYKKYGDYKNFPIAEYINENAIYIGIHSLVTEKITKDLANEISKL